MYSIVNHYHILLFLPLCMFLHLPMTLPVITSKVYQIFYLGICITLKQRFYLIEPDAS